MNCCPSTYLCAKTRHNKTLQTKDKDKEMNAEIGVGMNMTHELFLAKVVEVEVKKGRVGDLGDGED